MPHVDFTCPKCRGEAIADVPPGGGRVECPFCGVGIRVNAPGKPPTPAKPAPKRVKAVVEDDLPDDDREEEKPRQKKKGKQKKAASGGVPVWAWAAGGGGLLVVAVVLVLTLGGKKPPEQAAAPGTPPDQGVQPGGPTTPTPPGGNPPKTDPPKKDPPKKDPPKIDPPKIDPPVAGGEIDAGWPALPPRSRQQERVDAPNRTPVLVRAPVPGPLVSLDGRRAVSPRASPHRGLLARVGPAGGAGRRPGRVRATTRDAVLRESPGDLTGLTPAGTFGWPGSPCRGGEATPRRWRVTRASRVEWVALPDADVMDYVKLASALDAAAARSRRRAREGHEDPRAPAKASDARPLPTRRRDSRVNYLTSPPPWPAPRDGRSEASPRRGGGPRPWVRHARPADRHPTTSHKVFGPRPPVRPPRGRPRRPVGPWAVAYACCSRDFTGRPSSRLRRRGGNPPAWAKVIEPACRHDHVRSRPCLRRGRRGRGRVRFLAAENNYALHPPASDSSCSAAPRLLPGVRRGRDDCRARTRAVPERQRPAAAVNAMADRLEQIPDLPKRPAPCSVRFAPRRGRRADPAGRWTRRGTGEPSLSAVAAGAGGEYLHLAPHDHLRPAAEPPGSRPGGSQESPFLEDHPLRGMVAAPTTGQVWTPRRRSPVGDPLGGAGW